MAQWLPLQLPALPPVGILAYLSSKSLVDLGGYGKYEKISDQELLIQEGAVQTRLYILVEGSLQISGMSSGKEIIYCKIEPGECLGEVCLFEEGTASATVCSIGESILWSLDIHELIKYLSEHLGGGGALLMGIARCLSHRLRSANQQVSDSHHDEVKINFSDKTTPLRANAPQAGPSFLEKLSLKLKRVEEPKNKISKDIKL